MSNNLIRIATRKSPLALWQAEFIKAELLAAHPGLEVELVGMVSKGDKILDAPLSKIGGKGLFVKELEQSMLASETDVAVHSMKDVPMELPEGLRLAIICERETPTDAFVSNAYNSLDELPRGAIVGTSSLRRETQLRELRPDLTINFLRGNVNTRLAKLDAGDYDAIILASAGLIRLEMANRIKTQIDDRVSLPAGGQGALGIECRTDDKRVTELLQTLHHQPTAYCVLAERAMNKHLEGGCQVPIASYAILNETGDEIYLRGLVGRPDGTKVLRAEVRGAVEDCEAMGVQLAEELLSQGADVILRDVYGK